MCANLVVTVSFCVLMVSGICDFCLMLFECTKICVFVCVDYMGEFMIRFLGCGSDLISFFSVRFIWWC